MAHGAPIDDDADEELARWPMQGSDMRQPTLDTYDAVPAVALTDYSRYRDVLAAFTPDAVPATFAAWWNRYQDDYQ